MRLAKIRRQGAVALRSCQGHTLRHITIAQANQLEALKSGCWRSSFIFQLHQLERADTHSSTAFSASETMTNAGLAFKEGASRTANLTEEKKAERELTGLPAEDFAERTAEKVRIWPEIRWGIDPRKYELEALASPAVQ